MNLALESIGLIAGSRTLPLEFARLARAAGVKRIVATAAEGETDPALATLVDDIVWLKVGQLGKMISAFTSRGVKQCVMLGQIAPKNLFDFRPDLRAMGVLLRLKEKNAHTIFGAIAKEISRLEIGQLVVVKNGTVLAVEGFEGTDKCLARGGELAGKDGGAVAVKVAKSNHDMRFDIPCTGASTMEACAAAKISVLALEAGRTLLLERKACEALAQKNKISLVTIE